MSLSPLLSQASTLYNCFHNWSRTAQKCVRQQWHWADIAILLAKTLLRTRPWKTVDLEKNPKMLLTTSSAVWWSQWWFKNIIWSSWDNENLCQENCRVFEDRDLPTVLRFTYNPLAKKKVKQKHSVTWKIGHYEKESKCNPPWKWGEILLNY